MQLRWLAWQDRPALDGRISRAEHTPSSDRHRPGSRLFPVQRIRLETFPLGVDHCENLGAAFISRMSGLVWNTWPMQSTCSAHPPRQWRRPLCATTSISLPERARRNKVASAASNSSFIGNNKLMPSSAREIDEGHSGDGACLFRIGQSVLAPL